MSDEQGTEVKEADAAGRPQEETGQPLAADSGAGGEQREAEVERAREDVVGAVVVVTDDLPSYDLPPIPVPSGVPLPSVARPPADVLPFASERKIGETYPEWRQRRASEHSCSPQGYCDMHDCEH